MRVAPSTPESYWRMGFSDDGEALGDDQPCGDDPFDAALAEYQAEQKCRAGTRGGQKRRAFVAVESEPIEDRLGHPQPAFGRKRHAPARHVARLTHPVTPTVAGLSLDD